MIRNTDVFEQPMKLANDGGDLGRKVTSIHLVWLFLASLQMGDGKVNKEKRREGRMMCESKPARHKLASENKFAKLDAKLRSESYD